MNCETAQERIMARVGETPSAEVATHLSECANCRELHSKAHALDNLIRQLPVPSSKSAKRATIHKLISVEVRRPSIFAKVPWGYVGTIAAAIVVVVTGWQVFKGSKKEADIAAKPRHELLSKQTNHIVSLSQSDSAQQRLTVWTDWVTDLKSETRDVYKVAPKEDLVALSTMFDKAVREGVVPQAEILSKDQNATDRMIKLKAVDAKLAETQVEVEKLSGEAPPEAREYLRKMSDTARDGRKKLDPLLKGV